MRWVATALFFPTLAIADANVSTSSGYDLWQELQASGRRAEIVESSRSNAERFLSEVREEQQGVKTHVFWIRGITSGPEASQAAHDRLFGILDKASEMGFALQGSGAYTIEEPSRVSYRAEIEPLWSGQIDAFKAFVAQYQLMYVPEMNRYLEDFQVDHIVVRYRFCWGEMVGPPDIEPKKSNCRNELREPNYFSAQWRRDWHYQRHFYSWRDAYTDHDRWYSHFMDANPRRFQQSLSVLLSLPEQLIRREWGESLSRYTGVEIFGQMVMVGESGATNHRYLYGVIRDCRRQAGGHCGW